jgi:hypothetical protein
MQRLRLATRGIQARGGRWKMSMAGATRLFPGRENSLRRRPHPPPLVLLTSTAAKLAAAPYAIVVFVFQSPTRV